MEIRPEATMIGTEAKARKTGMDMSTEENEAGRKMKILRGMRRIVETERRVIETEVIEVSETEVEAGDLLTTG